MRGLVAVLFALVACGDTGDPWIANVDGETIRLSELDAAVEPRSRDEPETPRGDLVYEELERLVSERVVLNRARDLGLAVSASDVDSKLETLYGDQSFLADAEYREQVRRQMLIDRVMLAELTPRLNVSDSDVLLDFEADPDRFATPERVQVRQIVVQERALARRLLGELRAGADFGELARQWSTGPEANDGGLLPPFARGELPEAFDRAFRLKDGELSDVIESPFGFHVFRMERRLPAREASLEEARPQIQGQLEEAKLDALRGPWMRELRGRAEIQVNEPLLESFE